MPGSLAEDPAAPPLSIRLLGGCEVRVHGAPLPRLRSRKGEWLLALLALRKGGDVERSGLAGTLWPDHADRNALLSLRISLCDLRRALGPEAARLRSPTPRALCLDLAGAEVDVVTFDQAIAPSDRASLEQAISLYGGPLLPTCTEEWVVAERQQREQLYLQGLELLAEQALAGGDPAAAAAFLRRAVATDPFRESTQRALMAALAADGCYAAANLVYRQLRLLLQRELNLQPAPETTALFHQLRDEGRRRAQLPPAAPPAAEDVRRKIRVRSPRRIPQPLTALVGREAEQRAVEAALREARLVTLTGAGGIGKTRLAIQVAEEVADQFRDGAWFIDLAPLASPALVPHAVAAGLGLPEQPGRPLIATLHEWLSVRQLLLVLDNCEHLLTAGGESSAAPEASECAGLVRALLEGCPHLRILATSRQVLGLTGELTWRVPPLSLPSEESVGCSVLGVGSEPNTEYRVPNTQYPTPNTLVSSDAVRLFVERAMAAAPGFRITERNAPSIAQLCRRLEGIPLAIELAAARTKVLSVEQLADRLDDRFRLLVGGCQAAPARQRTLRATIDWSYELLPEPERALLRRLSVFAGGWTLEAAEAVAGGQGSGVRGERSGKAPGHLPALTPDPSPLTPDVLDLLTRLVDKSLVLVEEAPTVRHRPTSDASAAGPGDPSRAEWYLPPDRDRDLRYRLLETVREYGQERLREAGETGEARCRHSDWFLQWAETAETALHGPEQTRWLAQWEQEQDNLRAALDGCISSVGSGQWTVVSSNIDKTVVDSASAGLPTTHCLLPADAGLRLGAALWPFWRLRGYWTEGRERLQQLLALPRTGSSVALAKVLRGAGEFAHSYGDDETGRTLFEESLAIGRELNDPTTVAASLTGLGELAAFQQRYREARALFEESLAIRRKLDDRVGIVRTLSGLGYAAVDQGEFDTARGLFEESLALAREMDDQPRIAAALNGIGNIAQYQGDNDRARALCEESLAIRRDLGDMMGIAASLMSLAELLQRQSSMDAARALFDESLVIRRKLGDKPGAVYTLSRLGHVALLQSDYGAARSFYAEGLKLCREWGNRPQIAYALKNMATLERCVGDDDRATLLYWESLALFRELENRWGMRECLEGLAGVAAEQGPTRWIAAAHLLGAASHIEASPERSPVEQAAYEQLERVLLSRLGEAALAAARSEGQTMPLEAVIRDALPERSEEREAASARPT